MFELTSVKTPPAKTGGGIESTGMIDVKTAFGIVKRDLKILHDLFLVAGIF